MMRGEQIGITTMRDTGLDPGGDPTTAPGPVEAVDDVLVDFDTDDAIGATRPDGIRVDAVLCLPRAWPYRSLRGAIVTIRGHDYKVVGDPQPIDGGLTPTRWNLRVEVTDTRG